MVFTVLPHSVHNLITDCELKIPYLVSLEPDENKKIGFIWEKLLKLLEEQPPLSPKLPEKVLVELAEWNLAKKKKIKNCFDTLNHELKQFPIPKGYLLPFAKLKVACFQSLGITLLPEASKVKIQGLNKPSSPAPAHTEWNVDEWMAKPLRARL